VARLNTKSNEAQILEAPADQGYASNDIYGMVQTDKMHFASGCGLLSFDPATIVLKLSMKFQAEPRTQFLVTMAAIFGSAQTMV
jgi:hypothetical protein